MSEAVQREAMEYDVVIVGAGPSGLAAAIRLKQLSADLTVAVVEKGAEVGAHILSGAVIDPKGISELFPNWKELGAPLETPVTQDKFVVLGQQGSLDLPVWAMPPFMNNHGNYIASLGNVCRWLGQQAEGLGVEIYPGMAASAPVFEDDRLVGVVVGEFGIGKDGQPGPNYEPGMELRGKYVFIGEGVRGSLAKVLKAKYGLCRDASPEKYGIGIKELWQVPDEVFQPGLAIHTLGWPLDDKTGGGSFMYHFGDNYVATGFVVHLNYKNPWLSPFDEFQRWKHHPEVAKYLEGGKRIAYGARAISEGGIQSVPQLYFPGGVLLGDSAGFVNVPRIKGSHNAIKSGIMAAEAAAAAIAAGRAGDDLVEYKQAFDASWVKKELNIVRNAKPMLSKFGTALGTAFSGFDMWSTHLLGGFSIFGTMKHTKGDAESTGKASDYKPIVYPKPDGVLSFDKLSSVFLSSTNHDENQPAHLKLRDPSIPIDVNLPKFGEPARLYCPAGVYEVLYDDAGQNPKFQINFQNCVHCKTCDIKDPSQNIDWTTPQGGDGPNYPNM
ncbi:electron transfer flavoprotein-ubiquinone oxidoreductase [Phenylobacterium sp.]|uniref:electron transfer flavoprotein-ubiquinone oxidoreductase n=1 Tax=Phenylobacterium sp. TaxID=1871053 RepID=UPI00301BE355